MLKNLDYSKILFLDIETVPLAYNFNELDYGVGLLNLILSFAKA